MVHYCPICDNNITNEILLNEHNICNSCFKELQELFNDEQESIFKQWLDEIK